MTRYPVVLIIGAYVAPSSWLIELNIRRAEELIFGLAVEGCTPLCPHSMNRFLFGTLTEKIWRELLLEFVHRCDAILIVARGDLQGAKKSRGTVEEHKLAVELNKPILHSMHEVRKFVVKWRESHEAH
jgi:hypothetical protein